MRASSSRAASGASLVSFAFSHSSLPGAALTLASPFYPTSNGDVATITVAADGHSLEVADKHEPDADVPVYDSHMLASEDVFDEDGEVVDADAVKL